MKERFNYFSGTQTRTFNRRTGRRARKHLHKLQFIYDINFNCTHSSLHPLLWTLTYAKHKHPSRVGKYMMHVVHGCSAQLLLQQLHSPFMFSSTMTRKMHICPDYSSYTYTASCFSSALIFYVYRWTVQMIINGSDTV